MVKILFVCLGNICRSPAAEGVMYYYLRQRNLEDQIYVDSAGTASYHQGERADLRMREHAELRGFKLLSLSRPVEIDDFFEFDKIIAMDQSNYQDLLAMCPEENLKSKIEHFVSYASKFNEPGVPDPYYGGADGFEYVLDIIEEGCKNILDQLEKEQ